MGEADDKPIETWRIDKLIENEDITLLMNSLTEEGWSGVMAKIDETLNSKESVTYSDITLALIEATQSNVRFVPRSVWEAAKDESIQYLEEKSQLEKSKNKEIDELQREKMQLQQEKVQLQQEKVQLQREKRQLEESKNEEIDELKKTILRLEKNAYVPFFESQKKEVPDSFLSTNAFPSTTPPRDASLVNSLSRAKTKQRKNAMTPIMTPIKSSDDDKRPQKPRRPAVTPIYSPRVTPAPRRMSTKFFTSSGLSGDIQRAEINIKNYLKTGKKHYDNKKFAEAKHCFDLGLTAVKHLKRKMKQDSLMSTLAANEKELHEYYQQTENAINKTPKT